MIYEIYQYGFRKVVFRVLEVYMFWHLQFLVTRFAIFGDSFINPHRKLQIVLTWTTDDITLQESKL